MIDLSSLKAPGWQRIVAELNAPAPDDRVYFERMLRILAQVSAARQAVLYVPDKSDGEEVDPRVELVWPPSGLDKDAEAAAQAAAPAGPQAQIQFAEESRTAARAAFSTSQARAFGLDKQEQYYGAGSSSGFVLAVPMHSGMPAQPNPRGVPQPAPVPAAVATLLIEPRSQDAVRSTLAMAEVLSGYVAGHYSRAQLRKSLMSGFALDLATRLIASVNTATNFKGACIQLCNDLAKQFAVDRVALGWVTNDIVKVKAISDVEHFDHRTAMVQKLASAMDECLDQEQPVLFPPPPSGGEGSDMLLSQAIVHAHRELAAGNASLKVVSIPLRDIDDSEGEGGIVGVLTLEAAGDVQMDLTTVELLQAAMDLIGPMLRVRRNDDRALPLRAYDSARRAGAWLVGTKHTVWKLVGVAVLALFVFISVYKTTYRPSAEAILEPRVRRIVSLPFDGVIKKLGDKIEPGAVVAKGDLLVELDTAELSLGLKDALGKIEQARTQAAAARKSKEPGAQGKVAQAEQQEERARAEADVYDYRINKARIVSPIAGTIIAGDLKDRIGSTMKTGDLLFQVAPLDDIIVTVKADERDIALIRKAFLENRATGEVTTKAKPDQAIPFQIERIVPLAAAAEGKNFFEVRCRLTKVPDWFRPGIEGIAKFNTEEKPLIWIGTRRILDQVRLWLWW
ncbi:MAG TPA: HlyD family efflux transporter periplasmic adaptor subunit [Phycisphaerales bacterium]|nr:HlyD family efflux transporter periplasmic adaptor subunit [Phycisphaerales bacterium]